jgi:hypothetical protein
MTVRTPLKLNSTDLQTMAVADINSINARAAYLYFTDQSVALSIGTNAEGTLAAMTDTRMLAGVYSTDVTDFDIETETAEPTTYTEAWSKVVEAPAGSLTTVADTSSKKFPVYVDSNNNIQAMTLVDMYETFVQPALDIVVSSQPYKSHNAYSASPNPTNYTQVAVTPMFNDSIADLDSWDEFGANIDSTVDRIGNNGLWQLWIKDAVSSSYGGRPMYINGDNNLVEYSEVEFDAILLPLMRYAAVNLANHKVRFFIGGTGTTCGEAMTNTILNGSGNYQTQLVNTDDYRSQEFPDGVPVVVSTYYLKVRKVA